MKSNEEILKSKGITEHSANHNYEYLYKSVLESMKEAQIEVFNELIDRYIDSEDNMLNVVMKLKEELK
jgi:hypothetical protein